MDNQKNPNSRPQKDGERPRGQQSSRRKGQGRRSKNRPPAIKATGFEKFLKAVTFGAVDLTEKRILAASRERAEREVSSLAEPRIHVGNLAYTVGDKDLEEAFSEYGKVSSAEVVVFHDTKRSKGFGFVQMGSLVEARKAILGLHGQQLAGRRLVLAAAKGERRDQADGRGERRGKGKRGDRQEKRQDGPRDGGREKRGRERSSGRGKPSDRDLRPKPLEIETVTSETLSVTGVAKEATEQDLRDAFADVLPAESVTAVTREGAGEEAELTFASLEQAQDALARMDGKSFMGSKLKLTSKS